MVDKGNAHAQERPERERVGGRGKREGQGRREQVL